MADDQVMHLALVAQVVEQDIIKAVVLVLLIKVTKVEITQTLELKAVAQVVVVQQAQVAIELLAQHRLLVVMLQATL
jgi:hypothetical protein